MYIVPITDFRRKAGEYLDKINEVGSYILIRDGKPAVKITPVTQTDLMTTEQRVAVTKKLSGGFDLGNLDPKTFNDLLDKEYEEVLPR